jgi:DNA topoisomerase I
MAVHEIDCNGPGIRRVGAGRGFFYRDADGTRIDDPEVLERIRDLAIPPGRREVWICSDPKGHIQAVGLDAKGRRQYRYHREWQAERSRQKHERVLRFARRLPALRERVEHDLGLDDLPRDRVLACAVRLLELGFFRVGGEAYAEENGSFGLATLRKEHVRVRGDHLHFDFAAKSGQRQRCEVVDPAVAAVVGRLRRRRIPPEGELFAYRDEAGAWVDVRSEDINEYLQASLGDEFSAKDFRTWVGTVLAAVGFSDEGRPDGEDHERRTIARVTAEVAEHLGNTPAVARSAYIDPRVVERFEVDDTLDDPSQLRDVEELEGEVIRLIRRAG